jgi:hypothetical protein
MSIGLGGGSDREWIEPLDSEGNRNPELGIEDQVVGCHVGPYAGLNGINLQPGFEYQWCLNPSRQGGSPADSHQIHALGGQIVKDGDPEFAAFTKMEGMEASPLDTSTIFRELVFVRVPVERMAERREENRRKNDRMLRKGPDESFVNRASHLESERYSGRGPTRFALRRHQTTFNHDGNTVEVSLPDSGIVRTENID